jgi:CO/xanthine dehydrogenase FAD-binding subunit
MLHRFERPQSIAEAARLLASGPWAVLAGGTDLYAAHVGRKVAAPLLDITAIAGLRGIGRDERGWTIGATTTWTDVVRAAELPPLFDALKAAAREVGGVQIQNTGTVAGNLCNASPAADGMPVLLALGATVVLRSDRGERELPLAAFVLGSRRTARAADELVVAVRVPARSARARSAFAKLGGRRHLTIAISTVAVVVDVDAAGRVVEAGVAVGSCSAVAQRLPALEARLAGADANGDLAALLDSADLAPLTPIDDLRGSAAYRRDASATLVRRALRDVAARLPR